MESIRVSGHRIVVALATLMAACFCASTANAAVSVYTYSGAANSPYATWPAALNPDAARGRPDGIGSDVPIGGFIAFRTSDPFTTVDLSLEFLGVNGAGTVRLYVGQVGPTPNSFTALNSEFFALPTTGSSIFNFQSAGLSTYCVSIGGCDVYVVQAWTATTFSLDSIFAPNPEPSAWALMILGFLGVAGRLKYVRRASPVFSGPAIAAG